MRIFRHKKVARYRIGEFEFRDHRLALTDEDAEKFLRLVKGSPATKTQRANKGIPHRDQLQIVEVDPEAQQRLEKPLSDKRGRVVRGAMGSGKLDTPANQAGPNRPQDKDVPEIAAMKKKAENESQAMMKAAEDRAKQIIADAEEKAKALASESGKAESESGGAEKPGEQEEGPSPTKSPAGESNEEENYTTKPPGASGKAASSTSSKK